jgi:hypothetical protein
MPEKKFQIERYVEQVIEGLHYKGHVQISDVRIEYELVFSVPVPEVDNLDFPNGISDIRKALQLTIVKDQKEIDLIDEEYSLFLHILLEFVVAFYGNSRERRSNEGDMGRLLKGQGPMAAFVTKASISMTRKGSCLFNPEICEILNRPKFNFRL